MKKLIAGFLAVCLIFAACEDGKRPARDDVAAGEVTDVPVVETATDYSDYTIRIYSNSNTSERTDWLIAEARDAGFCISIDEASIISDDVTVIQAANENQDGDILFGLNETRWSQVVKGQYENLSLMEWIPTWAEEVGEYVYPGYAYGLVIQNVLMLYRTDELGTNGENLHFRHWADVTDSGYIWYRQNKVDGTTNSNINSAMLYPFIDPESAAGGVSVEGWKSLWRYYAGGKSGGDDYKYGFLPLNRGEVQIAPLYSSSLYGSINSGADSSSAPLMGTIRPENWALAEIDDGTYYIAEYLGILDRAGRTPEQTEAVIAFAEWFGSADTQAAWGEAFDSYPCNQSASSILYPDGVPNIYTFRNIALTRVAGTDFTYAEYVAEHSSEWKNIMNNLGYYKTGDAAGKEPNWDMLDWAALVRKQ